MVKRNSLNYYYVLNIVTAGLPSNAFVDFWQATVQVIGSSTMYPSPSPFLSSILLLPVLAFVLVVDHRIAPSAVDVQITGQRRVHAL